MTTLPLAFLSFSDPDPPSSTPGTGPDPPIVASLPSIRLYRPLASGWPPLRPSFGSTWLFSSQSMEEGCLHRPLLILLSRVSLPPFQVPLRCRSTAFPLASVFPCGPAVHSPVLQLLPCSCDPGFAPPVFPVASWDSRLPALPGPSSLLVGCLPHDLLVGAYGFGSRVLLPWLYVG